ncbi:unnamed protein product, partial [Adineta steineri]
NPFGGNAFGSGLPYSFQGPLTQGGFGQFGNNPFQGGNAFSGNGATFPPASFSSVPFGGQFRPSFGAPLMPGNGFGNQQFSFPGGQQMSF